MICPDCKLRWGGPVHEVASNDSETCSACRPDLPIALADVFRVLRANFPETRAFVTISLLESIVGMAKRTGALTLRIEEARKKLDVIPNEDRDPAVDYALDILTVPDIDRDRARAFDFVTQTFSYNRNDTGNAMHRYLAQFLGGPGPAAVVHDQIEVDMDSMELRVIAVLMQHVDRTQSDAQASAYDSASYDNARARIDALQELLDGWWCECGCTRRNHLWGPNRTPGVCRGTHGPTGRCQEFRPRARVAPPGPGLVPITDETELNGTITFRCSTCNRDLAGDSFVRGGTMPHLPVGEIQCRSCARNELPPAPRCPTCGRRARTLRPYGWECPNQNCAQRPWERY